MLFALEDFERDDGQRRPQADPTLNPLYQDGFAAGQAATRQAMQATQSHLRAELVQEIADMSFGFTEAQAHIVTQLTKFTDTLLQTVLPAALTVSLQAQLRDLLLDALGADATAPAIMSVSPDQFEAVKAALLDIDHPFLTLKADASLSTHAAITSLPNGETHMDLDQVLARIAEVFTNLPHEKESQTL